jgi:hypothetical protein
MDSDNNEVLLPPRRCDHPPCTKSMLISPGEHAMLKIDTNKRNKDFLSLSLHRQRQVLLIAASCHLGTTF